MYRSTGASQPLSNQSLRNTVGMALVALALAACSSSTASATTAILGATNAPTVVATTAPTATPVPAATTARSEAPAASLATAVPTAVDPCQLIPTAEASQLAGVTFGAGVESTTEGNGRICTYGGQTLNVFEVIVGQAPDVATAQAGKAQAQADIAKLAGSGVQFTEVPNLADGAAYATGSFNVSGQTLNGSAIYALKGTIFFGFSDLALGHPTPDAAALQAEVQALLSRLP
jgi:ABC-type Fe3+-hydroxamate transport system substrate-binding protein